MKIILYAFSISLFFSCQSKKEEKVNNILLQNKAIVDYYVNIDTTGSDTWQSNFKSKLFFSTLFESIINNNIQLFSPYSDDNEAMKNDIVLNGINYHPDSVNSPWYAGNYNTYSLGFTEEWQFDTNAMVFKKIINSWWPILYNSQVRTSEHLFSLKSGDTEILLAKDIITEINFNDSLNDFSKANYTQLFSFICTKAIHQKIKVSRASDCNVNLMPDEIKEKLGFINQTGEIFNLSLLVNNLTGIIFFEDWFYDPKTGYLSKKVKAIGPVRHYENELGLQQKSIPFVFFLGKDKINIL